MLYSHLLNQSSVTQALNMIISSLNRGGLIPAFMSKAEEMRQTYGSFQLPGFTAFTRGTVSPYQWLLPKPTCDADEFLQAYENFADRRLGTARRPGTEAFGIYRRSAVGRRLLTFLQGRGQWESTGLIVIAAAQHLGAEVDYCTPSATRLRLGPYLLEVTERGCWSNFRKAIVQAEWREPDEELATTFRATATTDPILRAVGALSEELDYSVLWAANTLSLALRAGVINRKGLRAMVEERTTRSRRLHVKDRTKSKAALEHSLSILREGGDNLPMRFYLSCVPSLISATTFKNSFCKPEKERTRRVVSQATRERWAERLTSLVTEVPHADAP